ncbi:MAG: DUF2492 family protein [Candidatus Saccharibacteria bacterium]|nr:DUF2492 family protein [Candidatus Saccharibacteria bacterium]
MALRNMKIGILSGSFDPVHAGHIALALAAKDAAGLDEVYFAPEVKPRGKAGVTHIAHRVAMLEQSVKPHQNLHVLEFSDANFTPAKLLPKLRARFGDAALYFICGEDMLTHMPTARWPLLHRLLEEMTLIVGRRAKQSQAETLLKQLKILRKPYIVTAPHQGVSSSAIRSSLMNHEEPIGLLKTTESYIKKHWLYAALFSDSSKS